MAGIFVNYRQTRIADDGQRVRCAHAQLVEAIVERLGRHFGRDQVFMDTEMRPSTRYPTELRDRLAKSELVIAVIHDRWLADLDGRAAGAERDWVRFELATALDGGKQVLPVLIDDAGLPGGAQLPADLSELVLRQAHRVRFGHWQQDLDRLIQLAELHVAPRPLPEQEEKPAPPVRGWRGLAAAALLGLLAPYAITRLAGVDPVWLTAFAIVLPVLLFIPAAILGASYAARGWLDTLDGHAAAAAHDTRTNVVTGLSIAGIAMVVLLVNDFFPPEVGLLSVAVVAAFGVTMGATWLREHRTAPEWPKPALAADASAIRGALARVHRHLDEHPAPLTRHQHEQARFALRQIRSAHQRLRDQSTLGRRSWLRVASPWLTWTHAALFGVTAGSAVGAYLLHSETGGHDAVALALAASAVVLACCLYLVAVEFAYRLQRWQRAKVVAEVPPALDELERRLRENSVPRPSDGHPDR